MKIGNGVLLATNILLFAILGWLIISQGLPLRPSPGWEYKDLTAALLTAVTVAMAFIGLAVGLAAIWGWQTISQGAAKKAAAEALAQNHEHLSSETFKEALKVLVQEQIENAEKTAVQDTVVGESTQDQPPAKPEGKDEVWTD